MAPCEYTVINIREKLRKQERDKKREQDRKKKEIERKKKALLIALEALGFNIDIKTVNSSQTLITATESEGGVK